MNDLEEITVYFATDGSATSNEIKMALAEKLAEVLIEKGTVKVAYVFGGGNTVYEMNAYVRAYD